METTTTAPVIDINKLTPEQRAELMKQLAEEEKSKKENIAKERAKYKELADNAVHTVYPVLKSASEALSEAKELAFDTFKTLTKMKAELYGREEEQNTHTFTSKDGAIQITIGFRLSDNWDDTANTGIAKVNDYIKSLATNQETQVLVDSVLKLLSKDSKGNLKASRVLQLRQMADKTGNESFIDAIQIIQDAYKPTRSKEFVQCVFKSTTGETLVLPLNISEAPFPSKEIEEEQPQPTAATEEVQQ